MESQSTTKLLQAQSHIWNHIFGFINSLSLKCAIDLGIPDIIHNYGQPMPLSKLITSLSIHPSKANCIYRLMRILIHSGFFSLLKTELEPGYVLTDVSILLLKDNPMSVTPFLQAMLDPIMTKPWYQLPKWFQNDDSTSFKMEHGRELWDFTGNTPKFNHLFNDGMASDARLVSSIVIEKCKEVFKGLDSLVDVGGGTGTMAMEIAKSFPHVQCMVYDLPHVIFGMNDCENLKYIAGDMFESIPPADGILFKWIFHDWNDEKCVTMLKNCKEAIRSNKVKKGKVIIIDIVVDIEKEDGEFVETQLFFDMLMMVLLSGKERTKKEWEKLIFSGGFNEYKITPIMGLRSLIEIYP